MRRRVSGMDDVDNALLEFYELIGHPNDSPLWMKPGDVYRNLVKEQEILDKSKSTIVRHMQKLADAGLLVKDGGFYAVTDLGIRYVRDELSDEEHEQLEEDLED